MSLIILKNNYDLLTKAEKKVADYILSDSKNVIKMSVDEFSKNASVAKSAVIRCCKSLGFEGFTDFKLSLAGEISKNKQLNFVPDVSENDTVSEILDKVFSSNVKTLHDTAQRVDRKTFSKVSDLLFNAKNIYIYGIGTSSALVNDFQYRLMQLGYRASCYTDVPSMKISTMNIQKGDVAVAVSHSGRTIATVDALELAKKSGADTVCITSYENSPVVQKSDYSIIAYSDEVGYPVEAVSARIAHISLMDSLIVSLSVKKFDESKKRAEETYKLINTVRY